MSPSARPPTRVPQGASPDFERSANAFLDVARDEDIWSIYDSDESDGSESDASASYDADGVVSKSDFSASEVDLRELEALIARLHARGAEFVRPKITQKHRDMHSLVAAAPRASRPTILPRGSVRGLPDPVFCGLHSEGVEAQRQGLSWMKPPGSKGLSAPASRGDGAKRKRRAGDDERSDDETTRKVRPKPRKRRETEAEAFLDRVANASRPLTEADRKRRGREIQYAQRLAEIRDAEASDARRDEEDVAATASEPDSPSSTSDGEAHGKGPDGRDGSGRDPNRRDRDGDPEKAASAGRVLLTVCWRARTRARSGVQPKPVTSVLVDVLPGETCMHFMGRMVRMPPGGVYVRDTQLSWGDYILDPMQELGGARTGAWDLDLRRDTPFELVLRVPVGAALAHRALREAAGESVDACDTPAFARARDDDGEAAFAEADVKRERARGDGRRRRSRGVRGALARSSGDGNGDDSPVSGDGSSGASGSGSGKRHRDENVFAASVKDLSNRALHPGRTDPKGMAALLRSYGAIKDDAASYSLVDVGSGDGHFALGLARAFPNAGVCGIEAQKDLYEESLRVAGRDCNFIHGLAEKELARCASARVVIATTHNFDAGSVESIVRVAARLPAVTHLVVGESSLCTPRCKAVVGPCCCFVPLGSEEVPTLWGNSHLTFSLYQRVARWVLKADSAERVSDRAALDALERGEIKINLDDVPRKNEKKSEKKRAEMGREREAKRRGKQTGDGAGGGAEAAEAAEASPAATPPRASEANPERRKKKMTPETAPSPVLATSPGVVGRLVRTVM